MTHTIGVINKKGGVGKTTTAVNVAAGLALEGRETLLIDLDPQGNATSALGLARDEDRPSSVHVLTGESPLDRAVIASDIEHLHIAPGTMELVAAESALHGAEDRHARLREALAASERSFDYILIDAPPSLGVITVNILTAANRVLIPVQTEYLALEGLSVMLETIEQIRQSVNPDLQILGFLLTMVDGRTNLARQVVQDVIQHFGDQVFRTVIARSVRLSEAPSHGQPILTYDPKSPSAEAHRALVREIIDRCEGSPEPAPTPESESPDGGTPDGP